MQYQKSNTFPYPRTVWDINNGHCENFAEALRAAFPGGDVVDLGDLYINDKRFLPRDFDAWDAEAKTEWIYAQDLPAHVVYHYQGKYYDAQNPDGVADWARLDVMRYGNGQVTRSEYLRGKRLEALINGSPARQVIQEVHWKEIWPKGFQQLMADWKGKHTQGLYVQFTNEPTGDTSHKAAHKNPTHSDPIGVYAYPLDYVINYPADIWYGHGTRRARILRDKSKRPVRLDTMSWYDVERLLWRARLSHLTQAAKRAFRDRAKGSTAPGKIFMSVIQMDLEKGATGSGWGGPKYDVRSGAEQTRLLRACGVDAVLDRASRHSQASINDREPWQIIFLTPQAFEVVTTYRLADPRSDTHVDTTANDRIEKLEKKLAAEIASVMGDRLISGRDISGLGGWSHRWTKGGRQIETYANDTSLDSRFKRNVGKPHRLSKKHTPHEMEVVVKSERGEYRGWTRANEKAANVITDFKAWWSEHAGVDTGIKHTKEKAKNDRDRERLRRILKQEPDTELGARRFAEYRKLLDEHPDWSQAQYDAEVSRRVGEVQIAEARTRANYAVFTQVHSSRQSVYGGGAPSFTWKQSGPAFPTKLQAIRDFVIGLEPDLKDAPDNFIRLHWPSFKRNHSVKVAAVTDE